MTETRSTKLIHRFAVLAALGLGACAQEPDDRPLPERLGDIKADLTVGSAGEDVRALHDYLTRFGYFPDAELARKYRRWRPAVSTPPAFDTVFDQATAEAVRRFQGNMGLKPTGIVDAATRTQLAQWRCGVPDNMVPADPSEKFSLYDSGGELFAHNWYLASTDLGGLSPAQVRTAMQNASLSWMMQSALTMAEASDFGNTTRVTFEPIKAGLVGLTEDVGFGDCDGGFCTIKFTNQPIWASTDLETVALHELGHALGLDHSSYNSPVVATMFPNAPDRTLAPDDMLAISTFWDSYWQLPGLAIDIAAGSDAAGSVWILGTDNRAYKWNGASWDQDRVPRTAVRIAVDQNGIPFFITSSNQIFRRANGDPFSTVDWIQEVGAATDIAIGANGARWIVATDQTVRRFNATIGDWQPVNAPVAARRIAVSPNGIPWIVTTSNTIRNLSSTDLGTGTWQTVPGTATDIGVGLGQGGPLRGQDGAVFKTDQGNVYVWNEQPAIPGPAESDAPSKAGWLVAGYNLSAEAHLLPAGSVAVSVAPNGRPWVIGTGNAIYTTLR